jgi:hypothetical protein
MLVIITFLGGHYEITCHLEFLTRNETPDILNSQEKIHRLAEAGVLIQSKH